MKKIVAIVLILAIICSVSLCLVSCNKEEKGPDKAIIYVTALFSGGLYNTATNEAVWEPFKKEVDITSLMEGTLPLEDLISGLVNKDSLALVGKALTYKEGTLLYDLTLDQDGNPYVDTIVPANDLPKDEDGNVMDISYGVFGIYKPFIDNLQELYGNEYDVLVFNQDWRLSPAVSAQRLEEYINQKGYKEVILMSHSMGGPVVNSYLSRSQANRDKVKLYMGYAPATLGSFDALAALTCLDKYATNALGGADTSSIPLNIEDIINKIMTSDMGDFFSNNIGLMTLVPSYQFLTSDQYDDGKSGLGIIKEGEDEVTYLTTKEEIYDFYKSLDWAQYYEKTKNAKGETVKEKVVAKAGEYANKDGYKVKTAAATLDTYYDSLFVNGKLACDSVNSYYFVGTEVDTLITEMIYDYNKKDWIINTQTGNEILGDGTVPFYSSIGGNTADVEALRAAGRIIEYKGHNHGEVGGSWNLMKDDIISLIDSVK